MIDRALELTNANLRGYAANATGKVKFLNILHGQSFDECRKWFDNTRWFNDQGHAVGWCFGSRSANDLHLALQMLIYMLSHDHVPRYLHFLGRGTPESIVIADIMRRTVPKAFFRNERWNRLRHSIVVTADASSEFQAGGRFGTIYERTLNKANGDLGISPIGIRSAKFESADCNRFPPDRTYPDVEGPVLGRHQNGVKFGDILDPRAFSGTSPSAYNLDEVSQLILVAHNVWVKKDATTELIRIEGALRRLEYGRQHNATADMADMMSRLIHSSSTKGRMDAISETLVACTIGLWKVFGFQPAEGMDAGAIYEARMALLGKFEHQARLVFGENHDGVMKVQTPLS